MSLSQRDLHISAHKCFNITTESITRWTLLPIVVSHQTEWVGLVKVQVYIYATLSTWIKSYLENRTQFVQFGSCQSYCTKISHGVPQGSILGPLMFIIYTNDLPNVSSLTQSLLFADVTNIFCSIGIPTTFPLPTMNLQKSKAKES